MSLGFSHSMKYNKGNERPTRVLFADVESHLQDEGDNRTRFIPFLWCIIYKHYRWNTGLHSQETFVGSDVPYFWDIVEEHCYKKTRVYLVTHHLEVDFMPMQGFIQLRERGWILEKLIANGRTLLMYWKKDKLTLIVMNNGNLFDGSIEAWGKVLGIDKLEMPTDDRPFDEWVTYCSRDTEIMVAMWDKLFMFMDEHDLGNFKVTKASMALSSFRHRFMNTPIAIHEHKESIALERDSYHGGRFEALQIGNHPVQDYYITDITSMYGWIMAEYELPYELRGYKETCTVVELMKRCAKYCVIADVDITIDEAIIPQKINDKMVYRPGSFRACLTTDEIKYVYEHGVIHNVYRISWYYKAKVLSEYARYFLALKDKYELEDNQVMRQMVKLFLNALYGKFGQHGYNDEIIGECKEDEFQFINAYDYDTKERYTIAKYGGAIHETKVTDSGYNTFVAIASHITAYGRLYITRLAKMAGWSNVYHIATDSLVCNSKGLTNLHGYLKERIPGLLKIEKHFTQYIVKDVNDVVIDGVIKIKGIPKKAVMIDDDTFMITEWVKITTLLKQNITDHYYTRSAKKHLTRKRYHDMLGTSHQDVKSDKAERIEFIGKRKEPKKVIKISDVRRSALQETAKTLFKFVD